MKAPMQQLQEEIEELKRLISKAKDKEEAEELNRQLDALMRAVNNS